VTASGKTEVYLQAIAQALDKNKSSIMLVPEISLTPQTIERFRARFKQNVAVLHSHLTGAARFNEWKKLKNGTAKIAIGARSAVFAPVQNLGLIVIDEEHEPSYKQQDSPRYHAREVAIKRAQLTGAVVILGSATPSLESYHNAKTGRYKFLNLTKRIEDRSLPKVQTIDLRQYMGSFKKQAMLSRPMQDAIKTVLEKKEQAILFLNRRGFATFANCRKCGFVLKCKNCDTTLVYHFQDKELVCHWCNWRQKPPDTCPKCHSSYINYFGIGTEKVESEVNRLFAGVRTARMDRDAASKRGSHKEILDSFKTGQAELLVGTQMIAKGLDYPGVTLVGVVSADTALHIPDFRSGERTFSLLTQVAGRAGRGKTPGRVLVQTFTPQHYAIKYASTHDYEAFFQKEMESRKELQLPPYTHLVRITFRSYSDAKARAAAENFVALLVETPQWGVSTSGVQVIGPAPSVMPKVRRQYRWDIVLKAKQAEDAAGMLRKALPEFGKSSSVKMAVDVDPL
jgi:primosomal protein N' (replication factor Y)